MLKTGFGFRRGRLGTVSPIRWAQRDCRQAETPLIVLSRFPRPALSDYTPGVAAMVRSWSLLGTGLVVGCARGITRGQNEILIYAKRVCCGGDVRGSRHTSASRARPDGSGANADGNVQNESNTEQTGTHLPAWLFLATWLPDIFSQAAGSAL